MNKKQKQQMKELASSVNVIFGEQKNKVNVKNKTIATIVPFSIDEGRMRRDILSQMNGFLDGKAVGVAKCSPEEKFDEKRGSLIAGARANNKAYRIAIRHLLNVRASLLKAADSVSARIELLNEYIDHNDKFIDGIIEEIETENKK